MDARRVPRAIGYIPAVLLLLIVCVQVRAEFVPLGDLSEGLVGSMAEGVSSDGTSVVGASAATLGPIVDEAFLWTEAMGMVGLGTLPGYSNSRAKSVSHDGTTVVGWSNTAQGQFEAFRWTRAMGMVSLGAGTLAWGVSADGNAAVGEILGGGAFRWTEAGGLIDIGGRRASAASADGSVVVGVDNSSLAFRWTQATGIVALGTLPGRFESFAADVSVDGTVVVGYSQNEAFRWTQATGMIGLGELPGGEFLSQARGVSADGAVIVGESATEGGPSAAVEAFIWDEVNGMRNLREVLIAQNDDLTGWYLASAMDVSADGKTIVGWGFNPDGETEGWLARIGTNSQDVTVDIKPYSSTNRINPKSKGKVSVAILSTDQFDATAVKPTSVRFGRTGTEAAAKHFRLKDVDRDGNTDIVFQFRIPETGIACGDASASLSGKTFAGQAIEGSDSIKPIECKCASNSSLNAH